jgi:hypothetical protein
VVLQEETATEIIEEEAILDQVLGIEKVAEAQKEEASATDQRDQHSIKTVVVLQEEMATEIIEEAGTLDQVLEIEKVAEAQKEEASATDQQDQHLTKKADEVVQIPEILSQDLKIAKKKR